MKIGVAGLWHLGNVYSLCLANMGHEIVAYDNNPDVISSLQNHDLPIFEPGLDALLESANLRKAITYTNDPFDLSDVEVLFLTYDTPVNSDDVPDNDFVLEQFKAFANSLNREAKIVLTSQLPVGTCDVIRKIIGEPDLTDRVIVHPENLRLGKSLDTFFKADRIIFGTRSGNVDKTLNEIFTPLGVPIIWIRDKSAEMSKHALNAFLALSVTFMGEISEICEASGADAHEVALSLMSDLRIGSRAYLSPGLGFAGGTLARDLNTLTKIQGNIRENISVLNSILHSNKYNNQWISRQIDKVSVGIHEKRICFWGISYTGNTSTLRRSAIYEEMLNLANQNYKISFVEDNEITDEVDSRIKKFDSLQESLFDTNILVISKRLRKFTEMTSLPNGFFSNNLYIIDPFSYIAKMTPDIAKNEKYLAIGSAQK
jgi:UDPglucose 6-dehydrogenase